MPQADSFLSITIRFRRRNAAWLKGQFYPLASAAFQRQIADGGLSGRTFAKLGKLLAGAVSGVYVSNVWLSAQEGPGGVAPATYAAGTITCTFANAANDTVTFTWGGQTVVLTESSTLTGVNFFNRGTTDATLATNLAACINRHPLLGGLLNATVVGNAITVTARLPGAAARNLAMTTNDATAFALVQIAGGTEGGAPFFPTQVWVNKNKNAA